MLSADEQRILHRIEDRRNELVNLLVRLIRFRTVAPLMGERAEGSAYRDLQAFVSERLGSLGFSTETFEIDAADLPRFPGSGVVPDRDLSNMPIVVGRRPGRGRSLLLNAHYDVVSPGVEANWSRPPFAGVASEGRVFGRGACDMKGGLAAMLHALSCAQEAGVDVTTPLVFESVPDEEQTSMGTLACCERGIRADAGIIPEPTGLQVLVACRGSFSGKIIVEGRAGHSEMAQPPWQEGGAVNAIMKAVRVLEGLEALNASWQADPKRRHRYLDPDTIVPTMIRGGEWEVMHPERVEITFTSDFVPSTKDIRGEIQGLLDSIARRDPWMREHPPRIDAPGFLYAGEVREDEPIVAAASAALEDLGIPPRLAGFGSLTDMVHLVNRAMVHDLHRPLAPRGPRRGRAGLHRRAHRDREGPRPDHPSMGRTGPEAFLNHPRLRPPDGPLPRSRAAQAAQDDLHAVSHGEPGRARAKGPIPPSTPTPPQFSQYPEMPSSGPMTPLGGDGNTLAQGLANDARSL